MKFKNYVKVQSLEEAYALNQKKSSRVLGGTLWMRLGRGQFGTAIDLSGLGLDAIEETPEEFRIGCMVTLRQLERHRGLNAYTCGALRESVRHIVGVQFRNLATVGGSIFGRFGFSDVLTMFLALDTTVELYPSGEISLEEFAASKRTDDILVRVSVKKHRQSCVYLSQRNTKTDFPVLTCAASLTEDGGRVVIGATPARARVYELPEEIAAVLRGQMRGGDGEAHLAAACDGDEEKLAGAEKFQNDWESLAAAFAGELAVKVKTGGNMRGSAEYRTHLVSVLTRRALEALGRTAVTMQAVPETGGQTKAVSGTGERTQTAPGTASVKISVVLNGRKLMAEVSADEKLYDFLRERGCYSVKCGCETSNCGLCTVLMDGRPVLSCSVLAARADGHVVDTMEGLQKEAEEFGRFVAMQGAEQCGFCNPGMIMNAIALFREIPEPEDGEIQEYLAGNLCRCSGYEGQTRAIKEFMNWRRSAAAGENGVSGSAAEAEAAGQRKSQM